MKEEKNIKECPICEGKGFVEDYIYNAYYEEYMPCNGRKCKYCNGTGKVKE